MTNIVWVLPNGQFEQDCTSNNPAVLGYWSFNAALADWWPANSNANDAVRTNNGTLYNVTYTNAIVGQGFYFNGSNSYISFGANAGNFGANDFAIDFWVQTTSAFEQDLVSKRSVCNWTNMWDVMMMSTGTLRFVIAQDSIGEPDCYDTTLNSVGTINDGNFHEITARRSGLALSLYIDGKLDSSTTAVTISNAHAYLPNLPQDVDVVSVEPVVRRVKQPHKYLNQPA